MCRNTETTPDAVPEEATESNQDETPGYISKTIEQNFNYLNSLIEDVQKSILEELDRAKLPLSALQTLGFHISVLPFTAEDKTALEPLREYMRCIYVIRDQLLTWFSSFSRERYLRYSRDIPSYKLTNEEQQKVNKIIQGAIAQVETSFKAIKQILRDEKIRATLSELEANKNELAAHISGFVTALQEAELSNADESQAVIRKSETFPQIVELSKTLSDLCFSEDLIAMVENVTKHINDITDYLKSFPLDINLAFML